MKIDHNTRRAVRKTIASWHPEKSAPWIDSMVDNLMHAISAPRADVPTDDPTAQRFSLLEMDGGAP